MLVRVLLPATSCHDFQACCWTIDCKPPRLEASQSLPLQKHYPAMLMKHFRVSEFVFFNNWIFVKKKCRPFKNLLIVYSWFAGYASCLCFFYQLPSVSCLQNVIWGEYLVYTAVKWWETPVFKIPKSCFHTHRLTGVTSLYNEMKIMQTVINVSAKIQSSLWISVFCFHKLFFFFTFVPLSVCIYVWMVF